MRSNKGARFKITTAESKVGGADIAKRESPHAKAFQSVHFPVLHTNGERKRERREESTDQSLRKKRGPEQTGASGEPGLEKSKMTPQENKQRVGGGGVRKALREPERRAPRYGTVKWRSEGALHEEYIGKGLKGLIA